MTPNGNPEISIIIPAFNCERFLPYAIESVLAQTVAKWELIVVDDGSTDGTPSVIRKFGNIDGRIKGLSVPNGGVSRARNTGAEISSKSSEFMIFLDADDIWDPDHLHRLIQRLRGHPEAVAANTLARFIDENGVPINQGVCEESCRIRATYVNGRVVSLPPEQPTTFATLAVDGCIPTPGSLLLRRTALDTVGIFDPVLSSQNEDWDMYIRLSRLGSIEFINEASMGYRIHSSNWSSKSPPRRLSRRRLLQKAAASADNTEEQERIIKASYRPAQYFFLCSKLKYVQTAVMERNVRKAAAQIKYAAGHLMMFLRGRP